MTTLRHAAVTDTGNVRPHNEDAYYCSGTVFAVADGMGGHSAGEVASAIAVKCIEEADTAPLAGAEAVAELVRTINAEIHDEANRDSAKRGMGTTLALAAVVAGDVPAFVVANVGDSRTYLLRDGSLRQISTDHSYVQELVDEGALTLGEARHHPLRNIVTRALGIDAAVEVDTWTIPAVQGDRLMLCSDGLVDEVDDDDILDILSTASAPDDAAGRLVAAAKFAGGKDNITVVVIDVGEPSAPPAAPPDGATRRRGLTLFSVFVGLAIVAASAWVLNGLRGYYVTFDGTDSGAPLVVRAGQPGGWLWMQPRTVTVSDFHRGDALPAIQRQVDREPRFDTLDEAMDFVVVVSGDDDVQG